MDQLEALLSNEGDAAYKLELAEEEKNAYDASEEERLAKEAAEAYEKADDDYKADASDMKYLKDRDDTMKGEFKKLADGECEPYKAGKAVAAQGT